jgi:hypothetical protein
MNWRVLGANVVELLADGSLRVCRHYRKLRIQNVSDGGLCPIAQSAQRMAKASAPQA